MVEVVCPVSEFKGAEELQSHGDFRRIKCPPLGMIYRITRTASVLVDGLTTKEAARLATWLIDQSRMGVEEPTITTDVLETATNARPLQVADRIQRLYRYLQSSLRTVGDKIPWKPIYHQGEPFHEKADLNRAASILWTESLGEEELFALAEYAIAKGIIAITDNDANISLTIDGWRHLEDMDRSYPTSNQAFVAMWFGPDVSSAYVNGIAPAIRDAGYVPMRIDQKEHANRIDDEIIAEIRRSRFVVADFTCGMVDEGGKVVAIPRGGVYYEAGFAQGLGIPVIWMCRQDHIEHVHFDTRQFNHITWTDAEDLRGKLKNRIGAVLGDGPNVGL